MRVVDLTRELAASSDGSCEEKKHRVSWTRIESPGSLMENGRLLSDYDLSAFISDAVLLDLRSKKSGESIDDEDLEAAEEGAGLAIREGEIVVLQTGWEALAGKAEYFANFPALSSNGAEYLEFKRIAGVGVDTPSVDNSNQGSSVHSILFGAGDFVIENLSRLEMIDESRFRMIALPLKTKTAASPVRAVAVLNGVS